MKIAMYWHNGRSLGHTAETAKISGVLSEAFVQSYFAGISGAFKGLDMLPSKLDVFKLPSFSNYDRREGWNYTGNQGMPVKALFELRSKLIYTYLADYRPDVLMVNHIPNGLYDELVPALKLENQSLRILTLRGILFDREKTAREFFSGDAARFLLDHYDNLIVHIDPNIFSLEEYYDIPREIQERIRYVGYLTPRCTVDRSTARASLGLDDQERIIVASMAGGQGAMNIWTRILEACGKNRRCFDKCCIITGPYLEYEDKIALRKMQDELDWLRVMEYTADMQLWMTAADLFIGAAGSSMIGEVISTSCNAIMIPRQVREIEQLVHSTLLAQRGIVRMCSLEDTLSGKLNCLIPEAMAEKLDSSAHHIQINGLREYPKLIQQLYRERVGCDGNW